MKIYATVKSERNSRTVKKGGDEKLEIALSVGNAEEYWITFTPLGLLVEADGGKMLGTGEFDNMSEFNN